MRRIFQMRRIFSALLFASLVVSGSSIAQDVPRQPAPKMSKTEKIKPLSCSGPICRADCRVFGGGGNQLCNIYCKPSGEYLGQCQTQLGCPLPC